MIFSKKNIPDLLTFSRGIFVLIITLLFIFQKENFALLSLVFFVLASISDFLDGYLSRKWKVVSDLGTVFDSLFDKVLILSLFFLLLPFFPQFSWLFLLLFWREILVDGIKNFLLSKGEVVSSVFLGKLKMVFQIFFISFCLLSLQWNIQFFSLLAWGFGILSLVSSWWSGGKYFLVFKKFLNTNTN